jgi:Flp pilus assembly pilin Flp
MGHLLADGPSGVALPEKERLVRGDPWSLIRCAGKREMRGSKFGRQLVQTEEGQDTAEYGLLVAFVAIVILVGVGVFGLSLGQFWIDLAADVAALL